MKKLIFALFLPLMLCSCSSLFEPDHAQVELNVDSIARQVLGETEFSGYIIVCNLFSDSEEWRKNEKKMEFFKTVSISKDDINSKKARSFKFTGIPMGISLQAMVFISGQVESDGRMITLYSGESQRVNVDSSKIQLNVELTQWMASVESEVNVIPDFTIVCEDLEQKTSDGTAGADSYPEFTVSGDAYTLEFKTDLSADSEVTYKWILNGNELSGDKESLTLDCLTNEYVNCSEEGELNTLIVVVTDGTQSKSAQIQFVLKYQAQE